MKCGNSCWDCKAIFHAFNMSRCHKSVTRTNNLPSSSLSSRVFQSIVGEGKYEHQHHQLDMEKLQQHVELLPDKHVAHLDNIMDVIHHFWIQQWT